MYVIFVYVLYKCMFVSVCLYCIISGNILYACLSILLPVEVGRAARSSRGGALPVLVVGLLVCGITSLASVFYQVSCMLGKP